MRTKLIIGDKTQVQRTAHVTLAEGCNGCILVRIHADGDRERTLLVVETTSDGRIFTQTLGGFPREYFHTIGIARQVVNTAIDASS